MKSIVRECYRVGLKQGIALQPASADEYIDLLIHTLIPRTAAHYPSMLQDLSRGKQTDIDALNGAIVRLARKLDIPAPANKSITEKLLNTKFS